MSDYLHDLCKAEARIAELKAVAEAAEAYMEKESLLKLAEMGKALRAAGYLGVGNE